MKPLLLLLICLIVCLSVRSQQDTIIKIKGKVWYSFSGNIVTRINTDLVRLDQCQAREQDYINLMLYSDSLVTIQEKEVDKIQQKDSLLNKVFLDYKLSGDLYVKDISLKDKQIKRLKTLTIIEAVAIVMVALIF